MVAARALSWPLAVTGTVPRVDAIVVLGSPLAEDGALTIVGEERVRAGVALHRAGVAPLLCMTGGMSRRARRGAVPEAVGMAQRAGELGVPAEALRQETRSRFTKENAFYSAALLAADGVRSVVVVTQPFHLRRARLWFRRAGFVVYGERMRESIQFTEPLRGVRWALGEYAALLRDVVDRAPVG